MRDNKCSGTNSDYFILLISNKIEGSTRNTMIKKQVEKDLGIILSISFVFAVLYVSFGNTIMEYGRDSNHPLILRFLPVAVIQFGMAGLGLLIVKQKNKESFREYGLVLHNVIWSVLGCLLVSVPTILFLYFTNDIHGFLPFRGMFLTKSILHASLPWNILGYILIAIIWGFLEGINYVIISEKVNIRFPCKGKWLNYGALVCAIICIVIHGMFRFDFKGIMEILATFILTYGMIIVKEKTNNAWGCIAIYFVIWNAF